MWLKMCFLRPRQVVPRSMAQGFSTFQHNGTSSGVCYRVICKCKKGSASLVKSPKICKNFFFFLLFFENGVLLVDKFFYIWFFNLSNVKVNGSAPGEWVSSFHSRMTRHENNSSHALTKCLESCHYYFFSDPSHFKQHYTSLMPIKDFSHQTSGS